MKNQTAPGPVERLREIVLHGRAAGIPHATRLGYAIKLAESLVSPGMVEELARVIEQHKWASAFAEFSKIPLTSATRNAALATAILTFLSAKALGEADGGVAE